MHVSGKSGRRARGGSLAPLVIGALALSAAGCGGSSNLPDMGWVSGTVTIGGQPLKNAVVTFTPQGAGRPSSGTTDDSGYYKLMYTRDAAGAMIGKHVVRIQKIEEDDADEAGDETATGLPPAASDGSLVKEVTSGSNDIDISL